ncbi:MAG TPA: hypothetical protein VKA70_00985 [Blastocatellia bacterium]|nr:hypothetical protein [Blastocatellia bacterium]
MTRRKHIAACLPLSLAIIIAPLSRAAIANDGNRITLPSVQASFQPVGSLYAHGAVAIDGRVGSGQRAIWGGEFLQLSEDSSVEVQLDQVGQVVLKDAAMARLSTAMARVDDSGKQEFLVASLVDGAMKVKLKPDARAYVESCDSAFTTSRGAYFTIRVFRGQPVIDVFSGTVTLDPYQQREKQIIFQTVKVDAKNTVTIAPAGTPLIAEGGKTKKTGLRAMIRRTGQGKIVLTSFTDLAQDNPPQADTPAAGRRVRFNVEPDVPGKPPGKIDPEGITNGEGVVIVNFKAGLDARTGRIIGLIDYDQNTETAEPFVQQVTVTKASFLRRFRLPIIGGSVGAVIAIIVIKKKSLRQVPPPEIVP